MTVTVTAAGDTASIDPVIGQLIQFRDFAQPAGASTGLGATLYGRELPPAGFVGAGVDVTVFEMVPNSSTRAGCVPAQGGTNNLQYLQITKASGAVFSDFTVTCTPQGHPYNGLRVYMGTGVTIAGVKVLNVPGTAGSPPGETFGIPTYRDTATVIEDCIVDGTNAIGGGSSGLAGNSSTNLTWRRCTVRNHQHGMPTNWQGNGFTTDQLTSVNNYHGLNHERVAGPIRHANLHLHPPGRLTDGKSHAHFTLQNDQADNPDVELHVADWSGGLHAATGQPGPLTFFISDGYARTVNPDGSITYRQRQRSLPKLYGPDGNLLGLADAGTAGDPKNGLPAVSSSNMDKALADPLHWAIRYH